MTRLLISLVIFIGAVGAFAGECVDENGYPIKHEFPDVVAVIEAAKSCERAQKMAHACTYGDLKDVTTAGAAYTVCKTELGKYNPTEENQKLLTTLESLCEQKYLNLTEPSDRSSDAFCRLDAVVWVTNICRPIKMD